MANKFFPNKSKTPTKVTGKAPKKISEKFTRVFRPNPGTVRLNGPFVSSKNADS